MPLIARAAELASAALSHQMPALSFVLIAAGNFRVQLPSSGELGRVNCCMVQGGWEAISCGTSTAATYRRQGPGDTRPGGHCRGGPGPMVGE